MGLIKSGHLVMKIDVYTNYRNELDKALVGNILLLIGEVLEGGTDRGGFFQFHVLLCVVVNFIFTHDFVLNFT